MLTLFTAPVSPDNEDDAPPDVLAEDPFASYRAAGHGGVLALLRAEHPSGKEAEAMQRGDEEGSKAFVTRFYELDVKRSLRAGLRGRTVVEHPVVFVVLASHAHCFPTEVEVPKCLEKDRNAAADTDKEDGQKALDWSDYHDTVVPGYKDEEDVPDNTFGLFSRDDDYFTSDEDDLHFERRRRFPDDQGEDEQSCKRSRREREEARQSFLRKRARTWRGADAAQDEGSLVRAFAMQEDPDYNRQGQEEREAAPTQEAKGEEYQQYYDYYMKYYQRMYGLKTSGEMEGQKPDGRSESPPKEMSHKPAGGALGLVGYEESDEED